jgi:hypothetical protein
VASPPPIPADDTDDCDAIDPGDDVLRFTHPHHVRAGELTAGWSVVFGLSWLAVGVAMAAVWNVSRQLGLSTWWLGPRSQPRPVFVMMLPFVAPALLTAGAFSRVRYLPHFGLAGAVATAAIAAGDLGRVRGIGLVELLIALAAAAVSLAALSGMYRSVDGPSGR